MRPVSARFAAPGGGRFGRSFVFFGLIKVLRADALAEVAPAFAALEAAVAAGYHAAGFVAYEAAAAFNPDLPIGAPPKTPLLWFAIFAERREVATLPRNSPLRLPVLPRTTIPDAAGYEAAITAIHAAIADGETYQVNYTLRQRFVAPEDSTALYSTLCQTQQAPFCAHIETGDLSIVSASPELFFARQGEKIVMRPMKGTARRAAESAADLAVRSALAASPKERAENLMIVDLVRSDLSRLAITGSVQVESLFDVESYPTVHQLTSTVSAQLAPATTTFQIFSALFPCGSVTGAPKRRTMEIIRDLEAAPRGLYCGAIGFVSPQESVFSVAIRTVVIDHESGEAELGIGSGVTSDSSCAAEYAESFAKSRFLDIDPTPFSLIESLRRQETGGYFLLERHLQRLAASAEYFAFSWNRNAVLTELQQCDAELHGAHKVRLLLAQDGTVTLCAEPLPAARRRFPLTMLLSPQRVQADDPFLFHKTTRRDLYNAERGRFPGVDEVLFCNDAGEVTEGSLHNLVLRQGGRLLTPALACGLLPGTLRGELLERGILHEAVLTDRDLRAAEGLWLINSVRGWRRAILVDSEE
ncbi:MAG: aminodeoxychorismate synthase component I [Desulfuromonadales bacterium]|nr:aminodeoxychorismate synthase component I [Desulfuromonadales bacterium]